MKALIGRKIGMTQIFDEEGSIVGITVIQAGPCRVLALKSPETDGYSSVQLGFETDKKPNKAKEKQFKKAKAAPKVVREVRVNEADDSITIGDSLNVEAFELGDKVNVQSISKGKGFAGTIKRHNFNTGPKSHGSGSYRRPGSIGSMYPQNIYKGKKMAGQLGSAKTTVKNQTVALIDSENNLIGIRGNVPGPKKSIVLIEGAK